MRALIPLALLTLLAAGPASGQRAQDDELRQLQAEYRDERVRARRLQADARDAAAEIAALDRELATLRRDQSAEDIQLQSQRDRLTALGRREAVLVAALAKERARQGRLLSGLQMMSRDPPPPLLIPADRAVDTVRASILMKAMAPALQARADVLLARQAEVARVRRLAALSAERLFTTESAQGDRRAEIESLTARKTALTAILRADAQRAQRAAEALEARIRALGGTTPDLPETATGPVATRLPGGRSRLDAPVRGSPAARFGVGHAGWRWSSGAGPVSAPANATVDHAGPLSGWGEVVILNLGPGWRAVIAGLDSVAVEPGQRVRAGEVLGDTGAAGEAYFELRREERPVDPAPWLTP